MNETRRVAAVAPTLGEVRIRETTDPGAHDELGSALRSGSNQAMTEIFSRHLDAVYNYC